MILKINYLSVKVDIIYSGLMKWQFNAICSLTHENYYSFHSRFSFLTGRHESSASRRRPNCTCILAPRTLCITSNIDIGTIIFLWIRLLKCKYLLPFLRPLYIFFIISNEMKTIWSTLLNGWGYYTRAFYFFPSLTNLFPMFTYYQETYITVPKMKLYFEYCININ